MKRHLFILCFLLGLVGTRASAYDFKVDGIFYEKTGEQSVGVTYEKANYMEDIYSTSTTGDVVIPSTVSYNGNTYNVTSIGDYAFESARITSITIPNSVRSIGDFAFWCAYQLKEITLSEEITYIPFSAFAGCSSLTSITIPKKVSKIQNYAFDGCSSLTSITVLGTTAPNLGYLSFREIPKTCKLNYPNGYYESYASWEEYFTLPLIFSVDGIHYNRTSQSDKTVEVTFQGEKYNSYPDEYTGDIVVPQTVTYADKTFTVTAIGESAFCGCKNITSIQLPSTIKEIKEYGVNYCTKLTSINLPEGLTTIGPRAFRICTSLTSLEIPSSVTSIGEDAFYDDGNLVSITFKGAINSIGNGAFSSCEKLTEIHVEDIADWCQMGFASESSHPLTANLLYDNYGSITGSKGALYINDEKITNLVIPDNVEKINDYAFYVCEDFTSVDLGKGVKSIGNYAFINYTKIRLLN